MAPDKQSATQLSLLRHISFQISSTPVEQLPKYIPVIVSQLDGCKEILSLPQSYATKDGPETGVAVAKLRAQISTLLQGKTIEARWSAAVLLKTVIEVGGWESLQKCEPWVRLLLINLGKRDPQSTKKLCIVTLTRIFMLTYKYPSLLREITTPSLPAYINSCMNLLKAKNTLSSSHHSLPVSNAVLESLNLLLPHHPTVFRSFLAQIRQSVIDFLESATPGECAYAQNSTTVILAGQLLVRLHQVAPKDTGPEEWRKTLDSTITSIHRVADTVFRCMVEDWKPSVTMESTLQQYEDEVQQTSLDPLGLGSWKGIHIGLDRLNVLLEVTKQIFVVPTASTVHLPLGTVADMLTRLLSLTAPKPSTKSWRPRIPTNNAIGKEERIAVWATLPIIHKSAMDLMSAIVDRCDKTAVSISLQCIEQVLWVFEAENEHQILRASAYALLARLLNLVGQSLSKATIDSLNFCVHRCCEDILQQVSEVSPLSTSGSLNQNMVKTVNANGGSILDGSLGTPSLKTSDSAVFQSARALLPVFYSHIPGAIISRQTRNRMDQTAVLARHKAAMLASIVNPTPKLHNTTASSLLPLLARLFPNDLDVEAALHPRMPVLRSLGGMLADEIESNPEDSAESLNRGYGSGDFNTKNEQDISMTDQLEEPPTFGAHTTTLRGALPFSYNSQAQSKRTASPDTSDVTAAKRSRMDINNNEPRLDQALNTEDRSKLDLASTDVKEHNTTQSQPLEEHSVTLAEKDSVKAIHDTKQTPSGENKEGDYEDDDEDDDFGELVLGPDTDED